MRSALFATAALVAGLWTSLASAQPENDGSPLRERYESLRPALEHNAFGRALHLASQETGQAMRGDVHAVLDHPYARVREGLASRESWCALLVLPFNVKGCELRGAKGVSLYVGRTWDTPIDKATRIDFEFTPSARDESLRVRLDAATGPLGTKDYHIVFSAVPLDDRHTFVQLSYGYTTGALSRWALQTYLATSGASKVGFSRDESGHFVGGLRGVLERNTMRYFLAIDAFLDTLGGPEDTRIQRRMAAWFDATEKYPRQLHEMPRGEYLGFKKQDFEQPRG